MQIFLTKKYW